MMGDPAVAAVCRLSVYGNLRLIERVASAARIPFPPTVDVLPCPDGVAPPPQSERHIFFDFPFAEVDEIAAGRVQVACGRQAHEWICAAVRDVRRGCADGIVTGPVNKEAFHAAGVAFPGHTELLAHLTGGAAPCMSFYSDRLFLSLATIHEAVGRVPGLLSVPGLLRTIRLTHDACDVPRPRIGVLALNPHAGENGLFGTEERDIIAPAIEAARADGLSVHGPLVPDTAFTWLMSGKPSPYDGYVAMYHDQGLIPFKMAAFDTGVNVTLGLPVIRTSPDHGTAFDLAWKGEASPSSMAHAVRLAARLAAKKHDVEHRRP
jgi:4-hydroxythreonine-4-phosphate dehydrogenase